MPNSPNRSGSGCRRLSGIREWLVPKPQSQKNAECGSAGGGLVEEGDRLVAIFDAELLHDRRDVCANTARLQLQAPRDLACGLSVGEPVEHLPLAARQARPVRSQLGRAESRVVRVELLDHSRYESARNRCLAVGDVAQLAGEVAQVEVLHE